MHRNIRKGKDERKNKRKNRTTCIDSLRNHRRIGVIALTPHTNTNDATAKCVLRVVRSVLDFGQFENKIKVNGRTLFERRNPEITTLYLHCIRIPNVWWLKIINNLLCPESGCLHSFVILVSFDRGVVCRTMWTHTVIKWKMLWSISWTSCLIWMMKGVRCACGSKSKCSHQCIVAQAIYPMSMIRDQMRLSAMSLCSVF